MPSTRTFPVYSGPRRVGNIEEAQNIHEEAVEISPSTWYRAYNDSPYYMVGHSADYEWVVHYEVLQFMRASSHEPVWQDFFEMNFHNEYPTAFGIIIKTVSGNMTAESLRPTLRERTNDPANIIPAHSRPRRRMPPEMLFGLQINTKIYRAAERVAQQLDITNEQALARLHMFGHLERLQDDRELFTIDNLQEMVDRNNTTDLMGMVQGLVSESMAQNLDEQIMAEFQNAGEEQLNRIRDAIISPEQQPQRRALPQEATGGIVNWIRNLFRRGEREEQESGSVNPMSSVLVTDNQVFPFNVNEEALPNRKTPNLKQTPKVEKKRRRKVAIPK